MKLSLSIVILIALTYGCTVNKKPLSGIYVEPFTNKGIFRSLELKSDSSFIFKRQKGHLSNLFTCSGKWVLLEKHTIILYPIQSCDSIVYTEYRNDSIVISSKVPEFCIDTIYHKGKYLIDKKKERKMKKIG